MRASIIVCTYSKKLLEYLDKSIISLIEQSYDDIEIIVVIDGNPPLQEEIEAVYGKKWTAMRERDIVITGHEKNEGLSYSRNQGIKVATGDIIIFFDDDAVAHPEWVRKLVKAYDNEGYVATGGKIEPLWLVDEPKFLPIECYWLIGATHKGFREDAGEVRNTFGSNIGFKKEVFDELGGFDHRLGRHGKSLAQGEETEFAMRVKDKYGKGVYYDPEALVYHHIFRERVDIFTLLKRSYEQGRSRRMMNKIAQSKRYEEADDSEYIKIVLGGITSRLGDAMMLRDPGTNLKQAIFLSECMMFIGTGYLSAFFKRFEPDSI